MTHSFYRNPDTNVIEGITIQTNGNGTYYYSIHDHTSAYAHGEEMCQHILHILHGEENVSEQLLILFYREIVHDRLYQHTLRAIDQVVHNVSTLARHHKHMDFQGTDAAKDFAAAVLWDQEVWMHAIRRSSDVIATYVVTQTDITEEV